LSRPKIPTSADLLTCWPAASSCTRSWIKGSMWPKHRRVGWGNLTRHLDDMMRDCWWDGSSISLEPIHWFLELQTVLYLNLRWRNLITVACCSYVSLPSRWFLRPSQTHMAPCWSRNWQEGLFGLLITSITSHYSRTVPHVKVEQNRMHHSSVGLKKSWNRPFWFVFRFCSRQSLSMAHDVSE